MIVGKIDAPGYRRMNGAQRCALKLHTFAAFDQLLLAIRTLEADGGGRVTPNDLRNLRVIAQNLVQTKLDSLQVLERYEAFVRGKDAESRAERKQLEADLSDLKRSAEQRGGRRAANLEAQLQLKTEECEYLRRVNAELQAEGGAGRGEAEEAQEALKLKAAEVESLRAELAEAKAKHEEAAKKLINGHVPILRDVTNGAPVTQLELQRVPTDYARFVDEMMREVAWRLIGGQRSSPPARPTTPVQAQTWSMAAQYLQSRIAIPRDLGPEAGAAFKAVILEVATVALSSFGGAGNGAGDPQLNAFAKAAGVGGVASAAE